MRLLTLAFLTLFTLSTSLCFAASRLEVGASSDSGWVTFSHTIAEHESGTAIVNGRFLRNIEDNTTLGSGGLDVVVPIDAVRGLQVGGGAKAYAASSGNQDIVNVALGVLVDFFPPALHGLGVGGNFYYAPKISSGRDADSLMETNARLAYRLSPMMEFFVAYTNIRVDLGRRGDRSLEESGRIGMAFSF